MKTKTIRTIVIAAAIAALGAMGIAAGASNMIVPENYSERDAQSDEFVKNGYPGRYDYTPNPDAEGLIFINDINANDEDNTNNNQTADLTVPDDVYTDETETDVPDSEMSLKEKYADYSWDDLEKHTIKINEPSYDKRVYYTYILDLDNEDTIMDGDVIKVGRWEYEFYQALNDNNEGHSYGAGWMSAFAEKYTVNDRKMLANGIALAHQEGNSRSWEQIKYVEGEGWVYTGTHCNDRLVAAIEEGIAMYGNNFTIWY